jgi:Kyakuja-Dileera-Zisupton transposase
MQHRRFSSVKDDQPLMEMDDSIMFIPEHLLQEAKEHVSQQRSINKQSRRQDARVPSGSLDECEQSHRAARHRGDETTKGVFASTGLMAMVCRHDIPLFFCDITAPGEQQFYAIALLCRLASFLPKNATIGTLYDIACVLDRSIAKVRPESNLVS